MKHKPTSTKETSVTEIVLPIGTCPLDIFTFQCWLKTTHGGHIYQYVSEPTQTGFSVQINSLGHIECAINTTLLRIEAISTLGGLNDDHWHLLSICYQYNEIKCYIDSEITHIQQQHIPLITDGASYSDFLLSNKHIDAIFDGSIIDTTLLNRCLSDAEIFDYYQYPYQQKVITENNLHIYQKRHSDHGETVNFIKPKRQEVMLIIFNDTEYDFKKLTPSSNLFLKQLPNIIPSNERCTYIIESSNECWPHFIYQVDYIASECSDIKISVDIFKSLTPYRSTVHINAVDELESDCLINQSTETRLSAEIRISENTVITQAKHFMHFLNEVRSYIRAENIITNGRYYSEQQFLVSTGKQMINYQLACQLFNRRLQKRPLAIIKCTSTHDVKVVYKAAIDYNLPISVRSGGHDHEGESGQTNTIVIDLSNMDSIEIDPISGIAAIGPGTTIATLTTALAKKGLMIPHSTTATVGISGFIMGGGWGPWCRKYGMCCESLLQAEIVLGIGETQVISAANKPELLWALKGGGGLSYGIVTRFFVQTFPLPPNLLKFELEWNCYQPETQTLIETTPTMRLLERWEETINADNTSCLLGTNLKIQTKSLASTMAEACSKQGAELTQEPNRIGTCITDFDPNSIKHNCVMYGHWEGNLASLEYFINSQFSEVGLKPDRIRIEPLGGLTQAYGEQLMESWNRESFQCLQQSQAALQAWGQNLQMKGVKWQDLSQPAPHRVTSRLADQTGLKTGHINLLESLTSTQTLEGNRQLGLFTYVTLNAIAGDFYRKISESQQKQSAFPYKEKAYIIQYQAWWNAELEEKAQLHDNSVYTRINRALDWIDACRDADIPNTSGAFISYKDKTIPTSVYFAQHYAQLQRIKGAYCQDPLNHFRSRKSII